MESEIDNQAIAKQIACIDFPWDVTRSLELALFRTFASPSISGLLSRTGEFTNRPQKRYDDTVLIMSEVIEWGYDSPRGRAALKRLNEIHSRFEIANEDFLYVLSTFIFEPIRWVEKYAFRPFSAKEKVGWFRFWVEVGHRMHILEIPRTFDAFENFNREYEARCFRFSETNKLVADSTLRMMLRAFPRAVRSVGRLVFAALLDYELASACGVVKPHLVVSSVVRVALRGRAAIERLTRRGAPVLRTSSSTRSYGKSYVIQELGPHA